MLDWLKRFTLSFGSNKYMRESVLCGLGSALTACLLAFVFIFFGIFIGKDVTFGADYNGATAFREFLYGAFADGEEGELKITVDGGKADVTLGGERVIVNTLANAADAERYGSGGYHLVLDGNDMTAAYDDFTVDCVPKNGGDGIDYATYAKLSATEKSNYELEVVYSGRRKTIDDTDIAEFEEYLSTVQSAASELAQLQEDYADDRDGYGAELYKLYVKTYYPDVKSLTGEDVPTLKRYYYDLIDDADGKYICIFGDMVIASFTNDLGKTVRFGCVHSNGVELTGGGRAAIDGFIKDLYYANLSTLLFFEMLNSIFTLMFTVLIIIAALFACRLACRIKHIETGSTFSACVKAVGSCVHVAALAAAVATVIFGFFRGGTALTLFALLVFAAIVAVRMTVFYACELKRQKNAAAVGDPDADGEIDVFED